MAETPPKRGGDLTWRNYLWMAGEVFLALLRAMWAWVGPVVVIATVMLAVIVLRRVA